MLPLKITSKQIAILLLLYKYRFLNRQQIQTMLNHKYFNRVNVWLADLTRKRGVKRIVLKDFQFLDEFADKVVGEVEDMVRKGS